MSQSSNNDHPEQLPPDVRPVEFMMAASEGRTYRSFPSLDAARQHPDAVMIMQADYGGQILLTCPVRAIAANQAAVDQLFVDLVNITWGRGFDLIDHDAQALSDHGNDIFYEPLSPGKGVWGGMGGGAVGDGLWVHPELEHELLLRDQIEDVLKTRIARLLLPPSFPNWLLPSLADAQRYPHGRVILISDARQWMLVNCDARLVRITEPELHALLSAIDQIVARPARNGGVQRREPGRVAFQISKHHPPDGPDRVLFIFPDERLDPWRDKIAAVLRGERPFLFPALPG